MYPASNFYLPIAGQGLGLTDTSYTQIGNLMRYQHACIGRSQSKFYINVTNGNLVLEDHAISNKEANGELRLNYVFNSLSKQTPYGGWRFLEDKKFTQLPPSEDIRHWPETIELAEGDGHLTTYKLNDGAYWSPASANGRAFLRYDGIKMKWHWHHFGTKISEHYNDKGHITARQSEEGLTTYFEYNDKDQLSCIHSPGYRYDIERRLDGDTTIVDIILFDGASNLLKRHYFNSQELLIKTEIPLDLNNHYIIEYEYDPDSTMVMKQTDGTQIVFVFDPDNKRFKCFQQQGKEIFEVNLDYPDRPNQLIEVSDGLVGTQFGLDDEGRIAKVVFTNTSTEIKNGAAEEEIYEYIFNDANQIKTIIHPDKSEERFEYEEGIEQITGLIAKKRRQDGQVTAYYYEPGVGKCHLITCHVYHESDPTKGLVTRYIYDQEFSGYDKDEFSGHSTFLRYMINPAGKVTEYRPYTDDNVYKIGLVKSKREYTENTYPQHNFPPDADIPLEFMDEWVKQQKPQAVMLSTYDYDNRGDIWQQCDYAHIDEKGEGIEDEWSTFKVTDCDALKLDILTSELLIGKQNGKVKAETRTHFDRLGRLINHKNELGNVTQIDYQDGQKQVITTYPLNGNQQQIKKEQYDEFDELSNKLVEGKTGELTVTRETSYMRDQSGRPTHTIFPDGKWVDCFYNHHDEKEFEISATGQVKEYFRDTQRCFEKEVHYDKSLPRESYWRHPDIVPYDGSVVKSALIKGHYEGRESYVFYDAAKRKKYAVDEKLYLTEWMHDTYDREIATIRYAAPIIKNDLEKLKTGTTLNITRDFSKDRLEQFYFYADTKDLVGKQDAAGYVTAYQRDAAGRLVQTRGFATPTTVQINPNFNAVKPDVSDEDAITTYFLNALGQRVKEVDASGYLTERVFAASGLMTQETHYANKVDDKWLLLRQGEPPTPAGSPEDKTIAYEYNLAKQEIKRTDVGAQIVQEKKRDQLGNIVEEFTQDLKVTEAKNLTGDTWRGTQRRLNAFDEVIAETNPRVALALIDPSLTPEAKEKIWQEQSTRFVRDDSGLVLAEIDALNHRTLYYYDADRQLVMTINPLGAVVYHTLDAEKAIIATRLVAKKIDAEKLKALTGGFITADIEQFIHGLFDEKEDQLTESRRQDRGLVTTFIDAEKNVKETAYNAFQDKVQETLPLDASRKLSIEYQYETRGLVKEKTKNGGDLVAKETYSYDNLYGKQTAYQDPEGNVSRFKYDERGDIKERISAEGQVIEKITRDAFRREKTKADALGHETHYEYDQEARVRQINYPRLGVKHTEKKNIFQDQIELKDGLGNVESWTHEADGQVAIHTDALLQTTQYQYDLVGRKTREVNAKQVATVFESNEAGQLTSLTHDADGNALKTIYSPDTFGNVRKMIGPDQVQTDQTFDRNNRLLVHALDPLTRDNTLERPALHLTTVHTYEGVSDLTSKTKTDAAQSIVYKEKFITDNLGRKIETIVAPESEHALSHQEKLNLNNQRKVEIDPNGERKWHFYDALKRERFTVDALGGVYERVYDAANRLMLERSYQKAAAVDKISAQTSLQELISLCETDSNDSLVYHFYDENNNERFTVNSLGHIVEKRYDAADRLIHTIAYAEGVDAAHLPGMTTARLIEEMTKHENAADNRETYYLLDAIGQKRFIIDANRYITEQRFDAMGKVIAKIRYANKVTDVSSLTSLPIEQVQSHLSLNPSDDRKEWEIFDSLNRVIFSVDASRRVTQFERDSNGNVLREIHFHQRPTQVEDYAKLVLELKTWQVDDKLDVIKTFKYDAANRKIEETDELNYTDTYQYDAINNQTLHIDKTYHEWHAVFNELNRCEKEIAPAVAITDVTAVNENDYVQLKLPAIEPLIELEKHIEHDKAGNETAVIEAANTNQARKLNCEYNACHHPVLTYIEEVAVDEASQQASWSKRPETIQKRVGARYFYDAKQLKVAEQDEAGRIHFTLYNSENKKIFELHPIENTTQDKVNYAVTEHRYNTFGEEAKTIHYYQAVSFNPHDWINLDLDPKQLQAGLPLQTLQSLLVPAPTLDREMQLSRDGKGNVTNITHAEKYFYHPEDNNTVAVRGIAKPEMRQTFNAFDEMVVSQQLVAPKANAEDNIYAKHYFWFDQAGHLVAESRPQSFTQSAFITYEFDVFGQRTTKREYAKLLENADFVSLSFNQLQEKLQSIASNEEDRVYTYQYDKRGDMIAETLEHEKVQHLKWAGKGTPPTMEETPQDLTKRYQYNAHRDRIATTFEDGATEYDYYDSLHRMIAHAGVARDNGAGQTLIPLTYYGYNAFTQCTKTLRFASGTQQASLEKVPVPIAVDATQDQLELKVMDNRGLSIWEQDAEYHVTGKTYSATKQPMREWYRFSNNDGAHLDEKKTEHKLFDLATHTHWLRDGVVKHTKQTRFNVFQEPTGAGPGDDTFPLYRQYDNSGMVWSTNEEGGIASIKLHNLLMQETAVLTSASLKLRDIAYAEIDNLLTQQPPEILERNEKIKDAAGRTIAQRFATSGVGPNQTVANVPISIVSGNHERHFGELSLTWVFPQERTTKMKFYLWRKDENENTAIELEIVTKDERCGVDVTKYATDTYVYRIDYHQQDNPITKLPSNQLLFQTRGSVQIDNPLMESTGFIVRPIHDHVAQLKGKVKDIKTVQLYQDNQLIAELPVVQNEHAAEVDLSPYTSGTYVIKSSEQASLPFNIYTDKSPSKPLAYEITTEMKLRFTDQDGHFSWKLSDRFADCPIKIEVTYRDGTKEQTEEINIIAQKNNDKDWREAKFKFNHAPVAVKNVTLFMQWNEEWIKVANQFPPILPEHQTVDLAPPLSVPDAEWVMVDHDEAERKAHEWTLLSVQSPIASLAFPVATVMYITGMNGDYQPTDTLWFFATYKDRYAEWQQMPILHVAKGGIFIDVSSLPMGVYPFRGKDQLYSAALPHTLTGKLPGTETALVFNEEVLELYPESSFNCLGISRDALVDTLSRLHEDTHQCKQSLIKHDILSALLHGHFKAPDETWHALRAKDAHEDLLAYCEKPHVVQHYLSHLRMPDAWLGYHTALAYAKEKNISLYIWQHAKDGLSLIQSHAAPPGSQEVHLCHQGGTSRFTLLRPTNGKQIKNEVLPAFMITQGNMVSASDKAPTQTAVLNNEMAAYHYDYDAWDNMKSVTNTLKETTTSTFNKRNMKIETVSPPVVVVNDNGSSEKRPVTKKFGVNERKEQIAVVDGNGHVSATLTNAGGQTLKSISAVGTPTIANVYNALSFLTAYSNAKGGAWRMEHNRLGQALKLFFPSHTDNNTKFYEYFYNEAGLKLKEWNPDRYMTTYDYDVLANITVRTLPEGQVTRTTYQGQQLIEQINSDNSRLTWELDFFGNVQSHAVYDNANPNSMNENTIYERDQKQQVRHQYSNYSREEHTTYLQAIGVCNIEIVFFGIKIIIFDLSAYHKLIFVPRGLQNLYFEYEQGLLKKTTDITNNRVMTYQHDMERRRVAAELSNIVNREREETILRRLNSAYDGLNREVYSADSGMEMFTDHDGANNRRHLSSRLVQNDGQIKIESSWFTTTPANKVAIEGGILDNGVIRIGNGVGIENQYDENEYLLRQRSKESGGSEIINTLHHNVDDIVDHVTESNPVIGQISDTSFGFNKEDMRTRYTRTGRDAEDEESVILPNGEVRTVVANKNRQRTVTEYTLLPNAPHGEPQKQVTYAGGHEAYRAEMRYKKRDSLQLYQVEAQRPDPEHRGRWRKGTANQLYNANDVIVGQQNVENTNPNKPDENPETKDVIMETTSDGLLYSKEEFENDYSWSPPLSKRIRQVRNFHTVNGNYMGSYTIEGGRYASDLDYIKNHVPNAFNRPEETSLRDEIKAPANPMIGLLRDGLIGRSHHDHDQKRLLSTLDKLTDHVGKSFPPSVPAFYEVRPGDTFASIAKNLFHSSSYAMTLATANGYTSGDTPLKPGDHLRVPSLVPLTNKAGEYQPYNQFLSTMIESLRPYIDMHVDKDDNDNFLSFVVKALVLTVATAFSAGTLAPGVLMALEMTAGTAGAAVVTGITTAVFVGLADAAEQEVAIAAGWQSHFSLLEAAEVGVTAGITGGMQASFAANEGLGTAIHTQVARAMVTAGIANASEQLLMMAAGVRSKFNFVELAAVVAAQGAAAKVLSSVKLPQDAITAQASQSTVGIVENGITSAVTGQPFNLQQAVGSAVGSGLGNQLHTQTSVPVVENNKPSQQTDSKRVPSHNNAAPSRNTTGKTTARSEHEYHGQVMSKSTSNWLAFKLGENLQIDDSVVHDPAKYALSEENQNRLQRWNTTSTPQKKWDKIATPPSRLDQLVHSPIFNAIIDAGDAVNNSMLFKIFNDFNPAARVLETGKSLVEGYNSAIHGDTKTALLDLGEAALNTNAGGKLVAHGLGLGKQLTKFGFSAVKDTNKLLKSETILYQKVGPNGEHLKFGITKNPETRYTSEQLDGGRLKIIARGDRQEMLSLERNLHETLPIGPEERQSFYVKKQVEKNLVPPPYGR